MKNILKLLFAACIGIFWFLVSADANTSLIFFFIILFALFFQPFKRDEFKIKEQYLEKLKENVKKRQEVNEELIRAKNTTFKDLRKREK